MAPGEDIDSGMESQENSAQDSPKDDLAVANASTAGDAKLEFSPDNKPAIEDQFSEEVEESLGERLWGLTEMFPETVRNVTYTVATTTTSSIQSFYGLSRSVFWIAFTSSLILFAPVMFEVERIQLEEAQRVQQKQVLLGPNAAVQSGAILMPPLQR